MNDLLLCAVLAIGAAALAYTSGCVIGYYIGLGAVGDQYQRMRRDARDVFAVTDHVQHLRLSLHKLERAVDLLACYRARVQAKNRYPTCSQEEAIFDTLETFVATVAAAASGKNAQELAYLARDPLALEVALLDVQWSIESLIGVIERRLYRELNDQKEQVSKDPSKGTLYGKSL